MKLVVDANILFSSLLPVASKIRELLLSKEYDFYAPSFLVVEIFRHKDKIFKNSKLTDEEIYELLNKIIERIHLTQNEFVTIENRVKAYDLCKDVDPKDAVYVALCLELEAGLWTGDKKLIRHLSQQGFENFFFF
jgi:predicted nucleic acid-binding protein